MREGTRGGVVAMPVRNIIEGEERKYCVKKRDGWL